MSTPASTPTTTPVNTLPARADIEAGVIAILADCLALGTDQIHPHASLIGDLGADSLDFVDILFSLEQRFAVKLGNPLLEGLLRGEFGSTTPQGTMAPEALASMREWVPALRDLPADATLTPAALFDSLTVEFLVLLVQRGQPK